jgi:hypothetical protein
MFAQLSQRFREEGLSEALANDLLDRLETNYCDDVDKLSAELVLALLSSPYFEPGEPGEVAWNTLWDVCSQALPVEGGHRWAAVELIAARSNRDEFFGLIGAQPNTADTYGTLLDFFGPEFYA